MKFYKWGIITTFILFSLKSYPQAGRKIENKLPPMKKGDWSLIVLPDTQKYSKDSTRLSLFKWMMEWVYLNKSSRNIKAILQVGDIVDNNLSSQWKGIKKSMEVLNGEIPYFFAQGNHDVGILGYALNRNTKYNDYFAPSMEPINHSAFGGSFEKGRFENAFYYLKVAKEKFLILLLEFAPRNEVLEWANEVAAAHPQHKIMLVIHEYMDEASRLMDSKGIAHRTLPHSEGNAHKYPVFLAKGQSTKKNSKNCGEEVYQKLVSKHSNFEFVFSGHHTDYLEPFFGFLKKGKGAAKAFRFDDIGSKKGISRVQQFMIDSQWIPNGGDAWMLVVQFNSEGKVAHAQTYSPLLEYYPEHITAPSVFAEAWDLIRNPGKMFELLHFGDYLFQDYAR